MLTSRYIFALRDQRGDDLAARLEAISLPPMDEVQRAKQMRAALGWGSGVETSVAKERTVLEARIQKAAGGNPGLQDILTQPLLHNEIAAVKAAGWFLFHDRHDATTALAFIEAAEALLAGRGDILTLPLLRLGAQCAERLGRADLQGRFLAQGLATDTTDIGLRANLLLEAASRQMQTGDLAGAEAKLKEATEHFKRLGDVRSCAVAMGRIGNIFQARGDLDEALRIHLEEVLPIAVRIEDIDSIAHIRLCCAQIRFERGGLAAGEGQAIHDELAESFALYHRLGHAEGIVNAGALYGQILAVGGDRELGFAVLEMAAAAFDKLGRSERAAQVRAVRDEIRGMLAPEALT